MNKPESLRELIGNITSSRAPLMIALRLVLILAIILMGVARLRVVTRKIANEDPYLKDIFHEYLMAEAVVHGDNPYLPLDELARMYVGELPYYPHPSPHPPFVAVLFLPLTFFPQDFDIAWLIFELLLVVLICIMLTKWTVGTFDLRWVVFLTFLMLAWLPVQFDLDYGQLSILLLFLLTGTWLSIKRGGKIIAGILLGLSIAIKLITLPILLYFVLKRDWRISISAGITFLGLNLLTATVIGLGPVLDFYTRLSSASYPLYRGYAFNYSAWSIGWRMFSGTGSPLSTANSSPPLLYAPDLAAVISFLLPLIILIAGMVYACRVKDMDISLAVLICISVVVSPISWLHYHTLLAIPIAVAIRWIARRDYPTPGTLFLVVLLLLTFFINERIPGWMTSLAGGPAAVEENGNQIPFVASLINWIPILEVIGFGGLLVHLYFSAANHRESIQGSLITPEV